MRLRRVSHNQALPYALPPAAHLPVMEASDDEWAGNFVLRPRARWRLVDMAVATRYMGSPTDPPADDLDPSPEAVAALRAGLYPQWFVPPRGPTPPPRERWLPPADQVTGILLRDQGFPGCSGQELRLSLRWMGGPSAPHNADIGSLDWASALQQLLPEAFAPWPGLAMELPSLDTMVRDLADQGLSATAAVRGHADGLGFWLLALAAAAVYVRSGFVRRFRIRHWRLPHRVWARLYGDYDWEAAQLGAVDDYQRAKLIGAWASLALVRRDWPGLRSLLWAGLLESGFELDPGPPERPRLD